ncbi:hypothetical protein [Hyunsoonleella rubra]|uniref:GLPGLI family protein n=1 Tax=Hyunsoonleella rubra TaxID=1737062 RepID=A0ABW5TEZ4_9FLAO
MGKKVKVIILACTLFGFPFLLKTIDFKLEIFPSVTLPSYSDQVNTDRDLRLVEFELFGIDKFGKEQKLDRQKFFRSIPAKYVPWIIKNNFGLKQNGYTEHTTIRFNITYRKTINNTEKDIAKTKTWLKEGLIGQKCQDSFLIVKRNKLTISEKTRRLKDKAFINDTIFRLYE